jgi:hypothetical protein
MGEQPEKFEQLMTFIESYSPDEPAPLLAPVHKDILELLQEYMTLDERNNMLDTFLEGTIRNREWLFDNYSMLV